MNQGPKPTTLALIAVAVLVLGGAVTYWQYSIMSRSAAQVAALQSRLAEAENADQRVQESMAQLEESREKLTHLELSVSEAAYVPTLLTEIEEMGARVGILVTGVRPRDPQTRPRSSSEGGSSEEQPEERKPYEELEIEVKGRGSYQSIQRFLGELNRFPKIVSVQGVELQPRRTTGGMGYEGLDMTVKLRAFVFRLDREQRESEEGAEKMAQQQAPGAQS